MACGRNSVGYEIEPGLAGYVKQRLDREIAQINNYNLQRLKNHVEFVRKHVQEKGSLKYLNSFLGFPVMTGQEQELKLSFVKSVEEVEENLFKATYLDDDYIKDLDIDEVTLEQLRVNGGVR